MSSGLLEADEIVLMDWQGARLRELRKLRGWTQEQLAELAEIDQSTISRFERGELSPGVEEMFKLSDALKVSCEAFRQPVGAKPFTPRRITDATDDD